MREPAVGSLTGESALPPRQAFGTQHLCHGTLAPQWCRDHGQPRVMALGLADGVLPSGQKLICPSSCLSVRSLAALPPPSSSRSLLSPKLPQGIIWK